MHQKYLAVFLVLIIFNTVSCNSQSKNSTKSNPTKNQVGGSLENREFMFNGITKVISNSDTSAGWQLQGKKLLLTGTVYQPDKTTPAPGVLIYYYQTNTDGRYIHKPEEKRSMAPNNLGQTHGYIRGWVKTDADGKYSIYTVRPGAYPDGTELAHVHLTVKEPNEIPEYYIDDIVFDDDKLMTTKKRIKMENRAGTGVVRLIEKEQLSIGERNIYLGLNIPNYPQKAGSEIDNGKKVGEDIISFAPYHAWGPDKGSRACPICKYGRYHGILFFVGNKPNWGEIKQWLVFLEKESIKRDKYLKVYFIYGNSAAYNKQSRQEELQKLGQELNIVKTALTYVPSFSDTESDMYLTKIDENNANTFLLYKRSNVIGTYINLNPNQENFNMLLKKLDETINEYFKL
jgi:protocatechuate 3,4-dioxygenase, beta subunit